MTAILTAALLLAAAIMASPPPGRGLRTPAAGHRARFGSATVPALLGAIAVAALVSPALAIACGGGAGVVQMRRLRNRRERRRRAEAQAMVGALGVLVGELRIGAHPARAFSVAAAESVGELGDALRAVAARARLGADVPVGIRANAATSAIPAHWERLAVVWQLAAEHGLAISALISAAHRDIAERLRFADRTRAALAGARATASILAALPALGVLMGQLIGARPIRFLLGGGLGGHLLVIGVALICAGLVWSDRIVDRVSS